MGKFASGLLEHTLIYRTASGNYTIKDNGHLTRTSIILQAAIHDVIPSN